MWRKIQFFFFYERIDIGSSQKIMLPTNFLQKNASQIANERICLLIKFFNFILFILSSAICDAFFL